MITERLVDETYTATDYCTRFSYLVLQAKEVRVLQVLVRLLRLPKRTPEMLPRLEDMLPDTAGPLLRPHHVLLGRLRQNMRLRPGRCVVGPCSPHCPLGTSSFANLAGHRF